MTGLVKQNLIKAYHPICTNGYIWEFAICMTDNNSTKLDCCQWKVGPLEGCVNNENWMFAAYSKLTNHSVSL